MTNRIGTGIALLLLACAACTTQATGTGGGTSSAPGEGSPGSSSPGPAYVSAEDLARACDGTLGDVPRDYPALGGGCRSHFTYRWTNTLFDSSGTDDVASDRGVRKMPEPIKATWDLGVHHAGSSGSSGWSHVWLFVPSLERGVYRLAERASTAHAAAGGKRYDAPLGALIEIVGKNDKAVWGRFVTSVCYVDDDDCYRFDGGRFAAAIDDVPSAMELGAPRFNSVIGGTGGNLCETATDCPRQGECVISSCPSGTCSWQPSDAACSAEQRCEWRSPAPSKCVATN